MDNMGTCQPALTLRFPQSKFVRPIDLLDHTLGHHRGRNSHPDLLHRYVPNQLQSTCFYPTDNFLTHTDLPRFQGLGLVQLGEYPSGSRASNERLILPDFLSLGSCLPGPGPRFALARASHVSLQRFCATTTLSKYMLILCFSFAVWNRNKGIVAIAATIWVTNASLLLLGEFPPVTYLRHVEL